MFFFFFGQSWLSFFKISSKIGISVGSIRNFLLALLLLTSWSTLGYRETRDLPKVRNRIRVEFGTWCLELGAQWQFIIFSFSSYHFKLSPSHPYYLLFPFLFIGPIFPSACYSSPLLLLMVDQPWIFFSSIHNMVKRQGTGCFSG